MIHTHFVQTTLTFSQDSQNPMSNGLESTVYEQRQTEMWAKDLGAGCYLPDEYRAGLESENYKMKRQV